MKIAVAGKGGSGKTTIAGTFARVLARRNLSVLAIDGDTNPNLAISIGIPRDRLSEIPALPSSLLQRFTDAEGKPGAALTMSLEEVKSQYGMAVNPNLILMEMGRVDHAGAG
jgi:CO dehydrogenase maturation factor